MKLICCPRCSHLMISRGRGRIAKCTRCLKDMRIDRGVGVVPVVIDGRAGIERAGTAIPVVDAWNQRYALHLDVWSRDGAHCRAIEIPLKYLDLAEADIAPPDATVSGRYPVPEPVLALVAEAFGTAEAA